MIKTVSNTAGLHSHLPDLHLEGGDIQGYCDVHIAKQIPRGGNTLYSYLVCYSLWASLRRHN